MKRHLILLLLCRVQGGGPALSRCSCIGPRASGGPSPWWLDRLFIFVQTKETVMLSCTFRLTPIICRLFYIHIFILLKHIHQRVIVRLTEQDDVLAPLLGWAPRLGLVLGPALAKAGRRSCRGVCRSDHNFPKTKFVSKALMIQ